MGEERTRKGRGKGQGKGRGRKVARVTAYNTNGPLPNAGDDHDALPNEGDGEGPAHENDTVDGNKEAEKQEIEIAEKPTKKRKAKGAVVEPSGGSKA